MRSQAATDRKLPDGEVASPTETSSSETSAPVGGISLLNRGRRKKQPACEGSYCNNYTHFHENLLGFVVPASADLLKSLIESPENQLHSLTGQKVPPTKGKTQIAATLFARQMGVGSSGLIDP